MSMESGFELDPDACEFGCMPMDHGDIPEPDAASLDEMPRVIREIENPELVLDASVRPFVPEGVREGSPGLRVNVSRPHGRSIHLSFVRRTSFGGSSETIRLKDDNELWTAFIALGAYLMGVDPDIPHTF